MTPELTPELVTGSTRGVRSVGGDRSPRSTPEAPATRPADFDELFRCEYTRLVRTLSAGADGAEEAVQEAFVQAYLRWRRVARLDDPAGWVRRVAVNRLLNQHRSRRRRRRALRRLGAPAAVPDPATAPGPDLPGAIASLPPRQRMAVALHYLADLPVAEIATAMGVTAGAVKYHLHEARERLRPLLEVDDG